MSVIDQESIITRDPLIDGFSLDELAIGHTAYYSKTVTEHDVYSFAGITGDLNPVHINSSSAEEMQLPGRIVHGCFTSGLVSAAIGTKMPGQGCLYLSQNSKFIRMVRFGDTLTVKLEVIKLIPEKNRAVLKTDVFNQNDEPVLVGEAVVVPKKGR